MGDDRAFFRPGPQPGGDGGREDGDEAVDEAAAFQAALVEVARGFGKTPREVYEGMGLNEFQGAYRGLAKSENTRLAASIVSSFYGSRAEADAVKDILASLTEPVERPTARSLADMPLPPLPEERPTLAAFGFERVNLGEEPSDGAGG